MPPVPALGQAVSGQDVYEAEQARHLSGTSRAPLRD